VEASRKRGSFDGRWPCTRGDNIAGRAEELDRDVPQPGRAQLTLVPVEPGLDTAHPHPQEAGTARLMAAMAAARSSDDRTRRDPWL
jgi:hypothetical protein